MNATIRIILAALVLAISGQAGFLRAQSTGGRILGTITDPSGATIPGASLSLINRDTGVVQSASSSAEGVYQFPSVPVGNYRLEVEKIGFQKLVQSAITVNINSVVTVDATLQLGETQQTVEVNAAPPLVDTTSTQLGAVVSSDAMVTLPLNTRDSYQFMQLQPGVQANTGSSLGGGDNSGMSSVNGGRTSSNNFMVNGGDANDMQFNAPMVQPTPDSIQEYRVLTNAGDAEYGRNSGAVINVVTKSGTNSFHGDVYEFLRNTVLDARNYFDTTRPAFHQNQYGGTLGGPIRKDKMFFFGTFERRSIIQPYTFPQVNVMSSAERGGNFAGIGTPFSGTLANASILNNRPGCATAAGMPGGIANGTPYSTLFPGNVIPTACMDPTALSLVQLIPKADLPNNGYEGETSNNQFGSNFTGKYDWSINKAHSLMFYYYGDKLNNQRDAYAYVPGYDQLDNEFLQQFNLGETWVVSPSVVNEGHFIWMREAMAQHEQPQHTELVVNSCPTSPGLTTGVGGTCFSSPANPELGLNPGLGTKFEGLPDFSFSDGLRIGNPSQILPQKGNAIEEQDNVTWVKGSHTVKFGFDIQRQQFFQIDCYSSNGRFTIGDSGGGPNAVGTGGTSYPDFELGLVKRFFQGGCGPENARDWVLASFAEDSWKATQNLTFNYGLRWEDDTPITDKARAVQSFRPGQPTSIYPCQLNSYDASLLGADSTNCNLGGPASSVFPTGLVFPYDKGTGPAMYNNYIKSFGPRFGLAYSPGETSGFVGKLLGGPGMSSIRMGWGLFYNPVEQEVLLQFSGDPPFAPGTSSNNVFVQTPYLAQNGTVYPNPEDGILEWKPGTPIDFMSFEPMQFYGSFTQNMRTQYEEQYNFTIQRQLPSQMMLSLAYVGSQGHRLLLIQDQNPDNPTTCLQIMQIAATNPNNVLTSPGGQPSDCGPGGDEDNDYYIVPGAIPAGMNFQLPDGKTVPGGSSSPALTLVTARPYGAPQCDNFTGTGCPPNGIYVFNGIFQYNMTGNANYNSFEAMLEKRFSHGLQFQVSYTFSKSLDDISGDQSAVDPFNPRRQYGLSTFSAPQRLVFSYNWNLPLKAQNRALGTLVDGWSVSGITTLQDGLPIQITSAADNELLNSSYYTGQGSPNIVKPFTTENPRTHGGYFFDPSIFNNNTALGVFGDAARSYCCGPGIQDWDFALHKNFYLQESRHFELRGEFFNIFNHTNFFNPANTNNPDGEITDSTFGKVQSAGDPRLVQLALKFFF